MSSQKFISGNRIAQHLCCCLFISLLALLTLGQADAKDRVAYFHNDALGSPVAATDEAGNMLWREEYAPYGQRLLKQDNGSNTLWYTGKEEEEELGIQYFGARWYDPSIGRFLAMDPVGFDEGNIQSYNKYAYANNNPYKYVDPDGRAVETALDIVSLGFSIAAFKSNPSFLNGLSVAYDGLATAVPFLPAGAGIIKNAGKAADAVGNATKSTLPSHSKHSLNQKMNRGVKSSDELDAIRNPLDKRPVKYDSQGRPSQRSIGEKAEIAVNPDSNTIVSVNPTSSKKAARLKRRKQKN